QVFLRDSAGERLCDCIVPPRTTDVRLGYLQAGRTRAVSFVGSRGGRVTFPAESLAVRAAAGTGLVQLRLEPADFPIPVAVNQRRRAEPATATAARDLPDIRVSVPTPLDSIDILRDSIGVPFDTVTPRRNDDPLGPIFQNR
ncbi:MAG TPA: hypothetical protein VFT84_05695, partial [Gemmatimonadales bacterium]|nr:hypothetical protein [Gemmatimonadales bacterium]